MTDRSHYPSVPVFLPTQHVEDVVSRTAMEAWEYGLWLSGLKQDRANSWGLGERPSNEIPIPRTPAGDNR